MILSTQNIYVVYLQTFLLLEFSDLLKSQYGHSKKGQIEVRGDFDTKFFNVDGFDKGQFCGKWSNLTVKKFDLNS